MELLIRVQLSQPRRRYNFERLTFIQLNNKGEAVAVASKEEEKQHASTSAESDTSAVKKVAATPAATSVNLANLIRL